MDVAWDEVSDDLKVDGAIGLEFNHIQQLLLGAGVLTRATKRQNAQPLKLDEAKGTQER